MHLCTENPCPIQDIERLKFLENGYKTTYSMATLEQFNEEVMNDFFEKFPEPNHPGRITKCNCSSDEEHSSALIWHAEKDEIIDFITQKLSEHKELILKVVREKAPKIKITGEGTYCQTCRQHKAAGECDCIGFNKGAQEFLNNLDTI